MPPGPDPDPAEGETDGDDDAPLPDLSQETAELIEKMMKKLAGMDLSVLHGLLLETQALLGVETEEEQFRLKTVRLAEKGFLPVHEAIGIYQPADIKSLRKRPAALNKNLSSFDPDTPLPPQFFTQFIQGDDLFIKTLSVLPEELLLTLESETAALINKIISADRIQIREKETLKKTIQKATAYLSLGLEVILEPGQGPDAAARIIEQHYLEDLFRTGSRAGIQIKTRAVQWYEKSFIHQAGLPLSFLGEHYLGVIGGLFLERPLYFDNYQSGELYRDFQCLDDIRHTTEALDRIISVDRFLGRIDPDIKSFTQGVLTCQSVILTLWAKDRIGLERALSPIPVSDFKPFFKDLFSKKEIDRRAAGHNDVRLNDLFMWVASASGTDENKVEQALKDVLLNLIREIDDEYGHVDPDHIDPRFMPHFLLTSA